MNKQDFRALPSSAQEAIRTRAVKAVQDGEMQTRVAQIFGVTTEAVRLWMRRYENGGIEALKAKPRGRPNGGKLSPRQIKTIARLIVDRLPDQLKLPFTLWTREAVAELIQRKYGVVLSRWTVGRYLKRWGFSPQKPAKRALEQNPELLQAWLDTDYPRIKQEAESEKAEIHWGDEMGLRSDHQSGTTWGLKGHTPVVPVSGQRFSCNMISAITNRGTLRFMIYKERFTAAVFIKFLGRLVRGAETKIYLIVDNHSVHRCRKVRNWLAEHSERICLFFLPPYSPELNPDEYLNNDVKTNAVGRQRPRDRVELMSNARSYLSSTQKRPYIVKNYFHASSVKYAM